MSIELLDPEPATSTALTVQQRAVQALGSDKARTELATLAAKSVDIKVVNSQAGRDQAHAAGMVLKRARVDIETRGKAARDDATKFSKAVIAEEKALVAIIEPEEQRVLGLRDAWDEARAAEKAEAERKERERIEAIQARLSAIREFLQLAVDCRTSAMVDTLLEKLNDGAHCTPSFEEFEPEALKLLGEVRRRVQEIRDAKLAEEQERARVAAEQEAERQRLAAERAELERQRQEQATQAAREAKERAEVEAKAKAARDAEEARLRAERDAQEAELRRQREEIEAGQRALREQQEAAQRAARLEAEAKEAEARRVAQAEADAAAAAERKRLDDEAAARRAAEIAELEAMKQEALRQDRIRNAAPVMLGALQVVAATPRIPREVMSVVADAISCATGESA